MKVYLSLKNYNTKPNQNEIKKISNSILNNLKNIDLKTLAEELAIKGKTAVLCELSTNKLSKYTPIISQELVMLDFDNKDPNNQYTINDLEKDYFIQNNACFYYKTFSDNEDSIDRFRVVFKLNKEIKENIVIENIYKELFKKYPQSDTTIGQTNRLFFGGNKGYEVINWSNTLDVDDILHTNYLTNTDTEIKSELITKNTPIYLLLKYKKYDLVREKLGNTYQQVFDDNYTALSYFKSLDMKEFLELPSENPFHDILHEEENPSASVFYSDEYNVFFYKCFSSSTKFTGDISLLLSKYLKISKLEVVQVLLNVTNSSISIDSELAKNKFNTNTFRSELLTGELENVYPMLYNYTKRYKKEIYVTLELMMNSVYLDNEGNSKYITFYSIEKLAQLVSKSLGEKISIGKMKNVLNTIVVTELVTKLPERDIPIELYEKIVIPQKEKKENIRISNFYTPSSFEDVVLNNMENISKILYENKISVSSLSYELIYRIFGEEKAKRDYPQTYNTLSSKINNSTSIENTNLTDKSIKLEKLIVTVLEKKLIENGYIFEDELINIIARKRHTKTYNIKRQYLKMKQDILIKYNLECKKCTKDIYIKFNINSKYSPKNIIFYKE